MANQQLIDYIVQVRKQGYKDDAIRAHLINHGYTQQMVDEAFFSLRPASVQPTAQKNPQYLNKPQNPSTTNKKSRFKIPLYVHLIVLLIVITVMLGLGVSQTTAECEEVYLSIHEIDGEKVICAFPDNSKIQMILKNSGEKTINHVSIEIKGKDNSLIKKIDNLNLMSGEISTPVVDFAKGQIESVTITPSIVQDGKEYLCKDKRIIQQNIKSC